MTRSRPGRLAGVLVRGCFHFFRRAPVRSKKTTCSRYICRQFRRTHSKPILMGSIKQLAQ